MSQVQPGKARWAGGFRAAFWAVCLSAAALAPARPAQAEPTATELSAETRRTVERLQARALDSDLAYDIVADLTTRIGPRLAGSAAEARAREWAVAMLRSQGFENVRIEPFNIPYWERISERATVTAPGMQKLVVATLAGSPSTPAGGVEAELVRFGSIDALRAAPEGAIRGRIVLIDEPTVRSQDGSGYGRGVQKRRLCAPEAQARGAVACLIRSVGTHDHRFAHQGGNARQPAGVALPAAAVSPPDADQLARLLSLGPVRVKLEIETVMREGAESGNVVAEIRGRERADEIVVIGGHLDSWDQGTGAIDDGAGLAITAAAAKLIRDLPRRPRRTIRVVFWGAEETGVLGAKAYAQRHADELPRHVVAAESDFGAQAVWRFGSRFHESALGHAEAIHRALAPLAIIRGDNAELGGPDVSPLREAGVPVFGLDQNGWDYFDVHHTADDTLDRIEKGPLRQNVAAWATAVWLAADHDWSFRAPPSAGPMEGGKP